APDALGVEDGAGCAAGGAGVVRSGALYCVGSATIRKYSFAVWPSSLSSSEEFLPGRSTSIELLPCLVTAASDTPWPLTRLRMICSAVSMSPADGVPPWAVITMVVPPARSMPSWGVRCPVPIMVPTSAMMTAASAVRGVQGLVLRFRDRGAFDPAKEIIRL